MAPVGVAEVPAVAERRRHEREHVRGHQHRDVEHRERHVAAQTSHDRRREPTSAFVAVGERVLRTHEPFPLSPFPRSERVRNSIRDVGCAGIE